MFMQKMEDRIAKLETDMKTKVDRNEIESIVKATLPVNVEAASGETGTNPALLEEKVNKKISEIRDSSNRERNIIIFGVKEPISDAVQDRKKEDTDFVTELAEAIDTDSTKVQNVVRIGKRKEENDSDGPHRPRPIKVSMEDVDSKKRFMRNIYKLKQPDTQSVSNEVYSRISVAHDMTPDEREANKKKIQEAKDRNAGNQSENFKFVVRGPPWERRIVKIPKDP